MPNYGEKPNKLNKETAGLGNLCCDIATFSTHFENLGVCRRYNGRVHPGARYPAGLRHVSGRGTPRATTGPGRGASERSAYSVDGNAVETYRDSQEWAPGVLVER
jgi:hypothetical protein